MQQKTKHIEVVNGRGIVPAMLELVPTDEWRLMSVDEMLSMVEDIVSIRRDHGNEEYIICDILFRLLRFHKMYNGSDSSMFFWRMNHVNADVDLQYAYAISNLLNYRIEEGHRVRNTIDKLITVANIMEIDLLPAFKQYVEMYGDIQS